MIVREFRESDLEKIGWTGAPRHIAYVGEALKRMEKGEVVLLSIEVDDKVVSMGGIDFAKTPGAGTLWMLNVHPDYQSRGIGTVLVQSLEERARERGIKVAELGVEHNNPRARNLYERLGYEFIGDGVETWDDEAPDGTISVHTAHIWRMRKQI